MFEPAMDLVAPPAAWPGAVTVAILAGGLGTRLRPVVADRPKVMAEVGGRPFLAWWLECLGQQGVREVVLCTGHRARQIEDYFGNAYAGVRLRYSVEAQPLGTGGALGHALPWLRTDHVLAINGDSFCDADLAWFWRAHRACGARASLVVTCVPDLRRFGRVVARSDGRVLAFEEKGETQGGGWINAGLYLLERSLVAEVAPERPCSLERDLLPRWLAAPTGVYAFPAARRFLDIGTPESYARAEAFVTEVTAPALIACSS